MRLAIGTRLGAFASTGPILDHGWYLKQQSMMQGVGVGFRNRWKRSSRPSRKAARTVSVDPARAELISGSREDSQRLSIGADGAGFNADYDRTLLEETPPKVPVATIRSGYYAIHISLAKSDFGRI